LPGTVGFLFLPLALPAAIGGMIGAQAGIWLSSRLGQRVSRILFSFLLLSLVFVRIFPIWK
jgi:uncharacterized membrane protein YfcA